MAEYTFFFRFTWYTSQERPYLGYKTSLNNLSRKNEIIQSVLSDHNKIKLEYSFRAHRTILNL